MGKGLQRLVKKVEMAFEAGFKDKEAEMQTIKAYVDACRLAYGINPTHGRKFELSCIAFGEGHNLLYVQLVTTPFGEAAWKELQNPGVRQMVLRKIKEDLVSLG